MEVSILGCDGSYPGKNGACSGYLVKGKDGWLQLDLGCGTLPRLMAQGGPDKLAALVITHWHFDHAGDMLALQYYLLLHNKQLRVLCPPQPHPLRTLLLSPQFIFEDFTKIEAVAGFSFSVYQVAHPVPAYAVSLQQADKRLVYTGDIAQVGDVASFCKGADLLFCDASFTNAQWQEGLPHLTAAQAATLAKAAKVGHLVLTHLPPDQDHNTHLAEAKAVYDHCSLAQALVSYTL